MNIIKFCFIAPLLILIPTESLPVAQPPIIPSHVLHIRKDLPGIISFGPIFISSVKRGVFTDHVSIHSCNGCPYGSNDNPLNLPLLDCKEKPDTPEIVEVEEPLEVISVQDKPDEEDDEMNDLVSDYNDFLNKSTLTSEQIYLIQMQELNRIREKELSQGFEVLNQMKEVSDELEPEKEIKTPVKELSFVQSNDYEQFEHSNVPQKPVNKPEFQEHQSETQQYESKSFEPEFEAEEPKGNPSENQEFENYSTVPQELSNQPNELMKPVHETIEAEEPISYPLEPTPEEIQKEVQEPENVEENSTEANIWSGPTSPEVAQSVNEYIENHKPEEIYPCPPKDSTQVSERQDNFIKSSLTGVSKRIKNYFNGVRAYAARHDDTTDFM